MRSKQATIKIITSVTGRTGKAAERFYDDLCYVADPSVVPEMSGEALRYIISIMHLTMQRVAQGAKRVSAIDALIDDREPEGIW